MRVFAILLRVAHTRARALSFAPVPEAQVEFWRSGSSLEDGFSGAPRRFITQLYEKAILEKPPCASATFVVHVHVRHPHSAPSRLCSHGALWIRGYTRTRGYTKGIGKCRKMENTLLTRSRESFAMSSKGSAVHACRSTHGCRRLQLWSHGQTISVASSRLSSKYSSMRAHVHSLFVLNTFARV